MGEPALDDEIINERIKQIRLSLQLSQAKFCKAIFLSNGAELELGKKKLRRQDGKNEDL
jgi:DNA-binding transcriptional regulator YiaG